MYFVISIAVFILAILVAGFIIGPNNLLSKKVIGSPYSYSITQADAVMQRIVVLGGALLAGALWPLTIALILAAICFLILMRLTEFLLEKGASFKKED